MAFDDGQEYTGVTIGPEKKNGAWITRFEDGTVPNCHQLLSHLTPMRLCCFQLYQPLFLNVTPVHDSSSDVVHWVHLYLLKLKTCPWYGAPI